MSYVLYPMAIFPMTLSDT